MNTLQQKYEILSSSKVGIEFELYTDLKAKTICKDLSRAIGKKIIMPAVVTGLGEVEKGNYHSEFEPTSTVFKLERDFSGGRDMYELITGPMPYDEARIVIIKILQWIKENGWTSSKCAIHLNVSFNEFRAKLREPLINLNTLKFSLGFDEEFIYSRFPNRKDSVYAKSIHNVYPLNRFIFFENPDNIDKNDYITPNEKYYGVNFTKLPKQYLELRYLGGEGYEKKTFKILEVLDYFLLHLYSTLQQGEVYSPHEKEELYKILKAQKKAVRAFSDPEKFLMTYPDIIVTVDMNGNMEILKAFWTTLRDKLFSLVVDSGLRKGHFNLDNDMSMPQLRNGVMKKANHIQGMELFDCEISGTISDCSLYRCKIKSSRINKCKLLEHNILEGCKVENTTIMPGNELDDCYVNNPQEIIDGKMTGGVIRKGIIGQNADISDTTLIVDAKGTDGDKKDADSLSAAFGKKKDNDSLSHAFNNYKE